MKIPELSVIVPVYNRGEIIRYTLESIKRASVGLDVEVIIVDDGSDTPIAQVLARLDFQPAQILRQDNQGLLFARLAGLERATGRNVLFLDSDDLVSTQKFRLQLASMETTDIEISYSDAAKCILEGDYDSLVIVPDEPTADVTDGAEFCIAVQPPPHSPIFRTDWIRKVVAEPLFPPSRLYNSVAEIWFYHNAAVRRARAIRVPGAHTIIGAHSGGRLTNHWEALGCASLAVMETFARCSASGSVPEKTRQLVGEAAFRSWRRLPRGFNAEFSRRLLAVWRRLDRGSSPALGGRGFQLAAGLLGPEYAARVLRVFQAIPYERCRTMSDEEMSRLLLQIGSP